MKNTGLIVHVLRPADGRDCTNRGVSARFTDFTVVDAEISGPFEPSADRPELRIVRRVIGGKPYLHLVPAAFLDEEGKQTTQSMFGGNFAYTSDSRFCEVAEYPLPIHDRVE